jgi:hypothetical protein
MPDIILTNKLGELIVSGAGEPGPKAPVDQPAIENITFSDGKRIGIEHLRSRNVLEPNYNSFDA